MIEKSYMASNIVVPQVNKNILLRCNIGKTIQAAPLDELIYLVAPYGSGKTMAVLSWLKEYEKKAAWVTLVEDDDLSESFWTQIAAALYNFKGEHTQAEKILKDANSIENPRMFLRETLMQISTEIDEKILIIDGFKHIKSNGLIREIKSLVSNMLGCWRIILIGRTELPPLFNDYLLKKHLCLITLDDLNFSFNEIDEYFKLNGMYVDKKELIQIYEDTDGWAAALNAILSVSHKGAIRFNAIAKDYVMSYFEHKIWEHLSETSKDFLLKTSFLDKLTPSLCHYVAGIADAAHILRDLYINGLFLSKREERDTYYYHRVFREFLLEKLDGSSTIDATSLYINAGWWLYEKNEYVPALRCFYRAKFLQGIDMAFKKIKPIYIGMDEYIKTASCLTSLKIMELKDYPGIAVRIALLHFLTGDIAEAQRIYKIVHEWLEPGILSIPPEEYTDFYWEVGWLRYVNPDEDTLFDNEFNKWVNVKEYAPHLHESHRARASTLRLPSILRGVRDFSVDIRKTLNFYEMNSATHNSIRDEEDLFITDIIFAEICYEREDYEQAEKTIKKIMPMIESEKYTELYFSCIVLLVKITRATRNPDEIDGLTKCLKKQIETNGHLFLLPNFHAFELRNRLASGIQGTTEEFNRENKLCNDKPRYYLIYRHITLVRTLLSEKKFSEATLLLGNLDFLLRQYKRNMDLIEVNILQSIAEYGLEHKSDARQYLKMALDRGRKCGFIRIFSDDAALLFPILNLIHKRDCNEYVEKIKASCKLTLGRSRGVTILNKTMYEPLTDKEIEILKLLQKGMKNKEIASITDTTLGTVKGFVHTIYTKLQVANRTEAIVAAMNFGII